MSLHGWMGKGGQFFRWRLPSAVIAGLMAVLLCTPCALAGQSPLEGVVQLTVEDEGVEQALRLLRQLSGVSLVYSPDLLPLDRRVDCPCQGVTVQQALERILDGTGLTFRFSGSLIRIVPTAPASAGVRTGTVLGRVLGDHGGPVANAMVQLEDGHGVLSDDDGRFALLDVAAGTHSLTISSIGWKPTVVEGVVVAASDTARVTVTLGRDVIPLPEILVSPGTFSILESVSPGTAKTLTREEIQTMPQVGEDIFRSLKRLPGVASHDISTKLNIRGGEDREVAVRLDGLELVEPYHMKDWDGALGIVDLNSLGGVELKVGGFGAEYGDKMGGIFDMNSRTSVDETRTTLGLSVTNVTAMSRGGFADGQGSWLLSARRGFMGILIRLIGEDERLSPQYYDVFGKVSYQPDNRHLVSAHVLHAGDDFGLHESEEIDLVDLDTGWESSYGWVTWEADFHPRVSGSTVASVGRLKRNRGGVVEDFGRADMADRILATDDRSYSFVGLRHDLDLELTDRAMLKMGGEIKGLRADYEYVNAAWTSFLRPDATPSTRVDSVGVDLAVNGHQVGAYVAARVRPVDALTTEVGLRWDRVSHTDDDDVSPRFLASLQLGPRTTLRGSWGRYFQSHGIQELEVGDGETDFFPAERADQVALGLEHQLAEGVDARVEVYDRSIADQRPRFINLEQELQIFPEAEGDRLRIDPGRGRARGVEFLVERRQGSRWAWGASYVLALAEDEIPALATQTCAYQQPCSTSVWVPRRYDQRHTVGLHVAYRPDPRWNLSWGWRYHSGWPATSWSYDATVLDNGNRVFWRRTFGPVRGERLPAYHRLDMRVTRDFVVHGNSLRAYLDVFNLYDRTNLASYGYNGSFMDGRMLLTRVDGQTLLPRLPTIGLRYEF
ncbi:MAG TPA: TonB-dependent receptor [Longimicrobiales bacterium]|nr:TonB-dependent receptor [Longimicrobiales bacterium]